MDPKHGTKHLSVVDTQHDATRAGALSRQLHRGAGESRSKLTAPKAMASSLVYTAPMVMAPCHVRTALTGMALCIGT
jgi:hypothetical protein